MNIFDFYRDVDKHKELKQIFELAAQKHPEGLPDFFLEKDLWVTEILRLLYDEKLLGDYAVAFKGGTALSKCWKAIDRFSEDIDLSIHWSDLAHEENELAAWEQSTRNPSQHRKFRDRQSAHLMEWSDKLLEKLNKRFEEYGIKALNAELEAESHGEKINVHFPRVTANETSYHLDYILLEFGGRNRGRPTESHEIGCYLADIPELQLFEFPKANVEAYNPSYIVWEKLTALHQFSTMEKEPSRHRLARHWYDVDCMLEKQIIDIDSSETARNDVVEMKKQRWPEKGVDYELVLKGQLKLIPSTQRLKEITTDHKDAIQGRMFYINHQPDSFDQIIRRLSLIQDNLNKKTITVFVSQNVRWAYSGAWMQAIVISDGTTFRSRMTLIDSPNPAIDHLVSTLLEHKLTR